MASIPGGQADKLGNEFERIWTIRHLIQILSGRALSVQIECLGDDERGTEFWANRANGIREAHQCKKENASHGAWSIADLKAKGILTKAKFQLDRDVGHPNIRIAVVCRTFDVEDDQRIKAWRKRLAERAAEVKLPYVSAKRTELAVTPSIAIITLPV